MRDAEYVIHPWEVGGQPRDTIQSLEPNSNAQLLKAAHGTMSSKTANHLQMKKDNLGTKYISNVCGPN